MSERHQSPVKTPAMSAVAQEEWIDLSLLAECAVYEAGYDHGADDDYLWEAEWYSTKHAARISASTERNDCNDALFWIGVQPNNEDKPELWYRFVGYELDFGGDIEIRFYEGDESPEEITPDNPLKFSTHMRRISEYLKTAPADVSEAPTFTSVWDKMFEQVWIDTASADPKVRDFVQNVMGENTFLWPRTSENVVALKGVIAFLSLEYALTREEAYVALDISPEPEDFDDEDDNNGGEEHN